MEAGKDAPYKQIDVSVYLRLADLLFLCKRHRVKRANIEAKLASDTVLGLDNHFVITLAQSVIKTGLDTVPTPGALLLVDNGTETFHLRLIIVGLYGFF